jgi:hypothetical protein
MSDFLALDEARRTLRRLTVIAMEANRTLSDGLNAPSRPPSPEQAAVRNRILDELSAMREGFMLASKASDLALPDELRELLGRLADWSWLSELGLRWTTDAPLERLGKQVILYQHALVALGVLPRLPAEAITYPRRSYRDIIPPGSASATLSRLEELEQTIWRSAGEPLGAISPEAVRRTYAFFEATTWLITHHLRGVV